MWILCTVFRLLVIECLLHYVKPFMAIICSFQQVSEPLGLSVNDTCSERFSLKVHTSAHPLHANLYHSVLLVPFYSSYHHV